MTEAHAEGDSGKCRCQGEEQALPSQASPAHTPVSESKDQLVESQSLYIALTTFFFSSLFFAGAQLAVSWKQPRSPVGLLALT